MFFLFNSMLAILPSAGVVAAVAKDDPAFISPKGAVVARPFDLSQVRLLDSIFQTNEALDEKYILALDPDRLLHTFRINAGLPSSAKPLGGWEAPTCKLRGHFMGHYLSACAEMYAATGDLKFKSRGEYLVSQLARCQEALGTGYLSAFPATEFDTLETKYGGVWAPYYTIHKIMAGLVDQYHYCGNAAALQIAEKMADYFRGRMEKLSPEQVEHVLKTVGKGPQNEYGGMSEVLHNLYAITGKPEYLKFADVFDRPWIMSPLANGKDDLTGIHANTHLAQVIGWARHYELTGDKQSGDAASYFWSQVTSHHSYVTGSNSLQEHFLAPDVEAKGLGNFTGETCNVYNLLKLSEHVFGWRADPVIGDFYELALYNHILASIEPETGMTTYFQPLGSGHFRTYGTPDTSFWCCNGTGIENHAKYGAAIYFHDEQGIWVNLFIPSELTWQEKNVQVRQETTFPQSDRTLLTIKTTNPTRLAMRLRVPSWTHDAGVKLNGVKQDVPVTPGSYVVLDRTWMDGDQIEFTVPMRLHLHHASDDANTVAVMYGPLVLAGDMGKEGIPATLEVTKNTEYSKLIDPVAPKLTGDPGNLAAWIKPSPGQPLTFEMQPGNGGQSITLKPYGSYSHERYAVYWQIQ